MASIDHIMPLFGPVWGYLAHGSLPSSSSKSSQSSLYLNFLDGGGCVGSGSTTGGNTPTLLLESSWWEDDLLNSSPWRVLCPATNLGFLWTVLQWFSRFSSFILRLQYHYPQLVTAVLLLNPLLGRILSDILVCSVKIWKGISIIRGNKDQT